MTYPYGDLLPSGLDENTRLRLESEAQGYGYGGRKPGQPYNPQLSYGPAVPRSTMPVGTPQRFMGDDYRANEAGQAMNYPMKPGAAVGRPMGNDLFTINGSARDGGPMSARKIGGPGWSLGSAISGAFGAGGRLAGAAPAIAQGVQDMVQLMSPDGETRAVPAAFASAYLARGARRV